MGQFDLFSLSMRKYRYDYIPMLHKACGVHFPGISETSPGPSIPSRDQPGQPPASSLCKPSMRDSPTGLVGNHVSHPRALHHLCRLLHAHVILGVYPQQKLDSIRDVSLFCIKLHVSLVWRIGGISEKPRPHEIEDQKKNSKKPYSYIQLQ